MLAIARYGFSNAILGAMAAMAVVLLPAIALWIDRPAVAAAGPSAAPRPPTWTRRSALRSAKFWSVAAPFALALTAQVGFLVHQIAILEPMIGRAQAGVLGRGADHLAIVGRFGLGAFAERLDMRRFAAWSVASQAVALLAICGDGDTTALFAACVLFGLSAGNLLTLPALVIQREFEAASFGHAGRAVVGDQPVHLRVRAGPARCRARRDRRPTPRRSCSAPRSSSPPPRWSCCAAARSPHLRMPVVFR